MGQVEKAELQSWCEKIVNDPALLAEDPRGVKVGKPGHEVRAKESLKTFCNIGVQMICNGMEYDKFNGMVANQMYDHMKKNWIVPSGDPGSRMLMAYNGAMLGDLVVLALKGKPHGHVCIVAPARPTLYSGAWKIYVPQVANVGKKNGIMGGNYAFAEVPDVFILGRTVS